MDSSLRVWSDCICVSYSIHRIQLNPGMRDGQFFNMDSTMPIESSETGDSGKVEVHVLDAGHFTLDTAADRIAQLVGDFMNAERRYTVSSSSIVLGRIATGATFLAAGALLAATPLRADTRDNRP